MPRGLRRYQESGQSHFVTFSCYQREPRLRFPARRDLLVEKLEQTRKRYALRVYGYVVMPEHVHLLLSEPDYELLADDPTLASTHVSAENHSANVGHPRIPLPTLASTHVSAQNHGANVGHPRIPLPTLASTHVSAQTRGANVGHPHGANVGHPHGANVGHQPGARTWGTLATALQSLKLAVSKGVARQGMAKGEPAQFWQKRYYDRNVRDHKEFVEKLRYMHRNPVKRGLVERPEDWPWSSFRHYATGEVGVVEIESEWTARRRERNPR